MLACTRDNVGRRRRRRLRRRGRRGCVAVDDGLYHARVPSCEAGRLCRRGGLRRRLSHVWGSGRRGVCRDNWQRARRYCGRRRRRQQQRPQLQRGVQPSQRGRHAREYEPLDFVQLSRVWRDTIGCRHEFGQPLHRGICQPLWVGACDARAVFLARGLRAVLKRKLAAQHRRIAGLCTGRRGRLLFRHGRSHWRRRGRRRLLWWGRRCKQLCDPDPSRTGRRRQLVGYARG